MIAIITYSDYPNGTPGAIRAASFVHMLTNMEYEVAVFHKSHSYIGEDLVHSYPIYTHNKYMRFLQFGHKVVAKLKIMHKKGNLQSVIIGTDVSLMHMIPIVIWCRIHSVKCIFDVTEWYSKEQFSNWRTAIPYWEREFINRVVIGRKSRVIAISSYLYNYFHGKGYKVTRIPIVDTLNTYNQPQESEKSSDLLRIIYAGSHLKMDNIPLIVEALSILSEEVRAKMQFVVYGLRKDQIENSIPKDVMNRVQDSLLIMGRRPNNEIVEAYSQADFSIVLRDPTLRVNKAGFPSKVVESMRLGVPVICNYSSDLIDYLTHNENSIIVDHLNAVELSTCLQNLVHMQPYDKIRISQNARQTVLDKLNSKLFEDNFKYIIS